MPTDTFELTNPTIGTLLSNTTPPIRVPDFQRDYSWETAHVTEFWSDILNFVESYPDKRIIGKLYFLGAIVMVNNGEYHLLLDGQQRLATATILLAALRDKINDYKADAARQIHTQFVSFEDYLAGGDRQHKLTLNVYDRDFFRDLVQTFPRKKEPLPTKRSHHLIQTAFKFFSAKVQEKWSLHQVERAGFSWAQQFTNALTKHVGLVSVVSTDEDIAAAIFETLNDRGIGLSTADLIRSRVLTKAPCGHREEIIQAWSEVFDACGTSERAQTLIRLSWIATRGDVKAKSLYRTIKKCLDEGGLTPLNYTQDLRDDATFFARLRNVEAEDHHVAMAWEGIKVLRGQAAYALLLAAKHRLDDSQQGKVAQAVVALIVRHNIVCDRDRTGFESTIFNCARELSLHGDLEKALDQLKAISPSDDTFRQEFRELAFGSSGHGIATYLLRSIDLHVRPTEEIDIAGPTRVHLEHIYPQRPDDADRWQEHKQYVDMIGNLTLLDKKLNQQIQNAKFNEKRREYLKSDIRLTSRVAEGKKWDPTAIRERQEWLCERAIEIWPLDLVTQITPMMVSSDS